MTTYPDPRTCPLTGFVHLVAGKWAIPVLYRLITTDDPVRFRELLRRASPVTQKELTKCLRLLESRGLVTREVFAEVPARVEYRPTLAARELMGALEGIAVWMRTYGFDLAAKFPANPSHSDATQSRADDKAA